MENIADAIIGDPTSGLAVEECKRVPIIRAELAAKAQLLLFLDEHFQVRFSVCVHPEEAREILGRPFSALFISRKLLYFRTLTGFCSSSPAEVYILW